MKNSDCCHMIAYDSMSLQISNLTNLTTIYGRCVRCGIKYKKIYSEKNIYVENNNNWEEQKNPIIESETFC